MAGRGYLIGGKHAWNGFDRNFDPGILRGFAEMVSQPAVGLCPDRGPGSRPSHCGRSRAPGTYLDFRLERGLRRWIAKGGQPFRKESRRDEGLEHRAEMHVSDSSSDSGGQ